MRYQVWPLVIILAVTLPVVEARDALYIKSPQADLGEVLLTPGITLSHTFVLRNPTGREIPLGGVKTTCGCTLARLSTETVAPGQDVEVSVEVRPAHRAGRQRWRVDVSTDDSEAPTLQLHLQAQVVLPVTTIPAQVHFGIVDRFSETERLVELLVDPRMAVSIAAAESLVDGVKCELIKREDGETAVRVHTQPPLNIGDRKGVVRLKNATGSTVHEIPVSMIVAGEIVVSPSEIVLPAKAGRELTRFVVLAPGAVESFVIRRVVFPDPTVTTQVQMVGAGYRVRLSGLTASEKLDGAELLIETDVETMPEIRIPIRVVPAAPTTEADHQPETTTATEVQSDD